MKAQQTHGYFLVLQHLRAFPPTPKPGRNQPQSSAGAALIVRLHSPLGQRGKAVGSAQPQLRLHGPPPRPFLTTRRRISTAEGLGGGCRKLGLMGDPREPQTAAGWARGPAGKRRLELSVSPHRDGAAIAGCSEWDRSSPEEEEEEESIPVCSVLLGTTNTALPPAAFLRGDGAGSGVGLLEVGIAPNTPRTPWARRVWGVRSRKERENGRMLPSREGVRAAALGWSALFS